MIPSIVCKIGSNDSIQGTLFKKMNLREIIGYTIRISIQPFGKTLGDEWYSFGCTNSHILCITYSHSLTALAMLIFINHPFGVVIGNFYFLCTEGVKKWRAKPLHSQAQ